MFIDKIRLTVIREKVEVPYETEVTGPGVAAKAIHHTIISEGCIDRENFVALHLNTKNKIIGVEIVSVGTLNASIIHPREVFKSAIVANVAHIVVGHNHPSGNVTPSREDLDVTRRLSEAGKLIGMEILDHLIVGDGDTYYSFREKGLL